MKIQNNSLKRKPQRDSTTPFAASSKLESDRQSEWLFRKHRPKRPAWKRD